jgi:lysophospholipase L1-like esterase
VALEAGASKLVYLMGTQDVIQSSACGGGSGWSGKPGDIGDPIGTYRDAITGAQKLYGVAVYVGTLPPIFGQSSGCAATITAFNQELAGVATAAGAKVIDFNSAMESSDFTDAGLIPNAAGYQVMTTVYGESQ